MYNRVYPAVEKELGQFPKVSEQLTNRLLGRPASNLTVLKKEVGNQQVARSQRCDSARKC